MIFTTIVCLEIVFFVTWFCYKIAGMIRRHKIITSVLIIGIVYLMISGHPSHVVNTKGQKNNNLANSVYKDEWFRDNSINGNSVNSISAGESQSVLYPGGDRYETGANGHKITLHNNNSAMNPTYLQMLNFIRSDKTDETPYNYSSFSCTDFAESVHNNAEVAGYKCAWVRISFVNHDATYACNAFNTVDRGLIFIDCTDYGNQDNDKTVDLKVGKGYIPEDIGDLLHTYYSKGIVKSYQIYW